MPCSATIVPIVVVAPATLTCWPTIARTPASNGSQHAGHAQPVRPRRERRVAAEHVTHGHRVVVEVEAPPHARDVVDQALPEREVETGDEMVVTSAPHLEGTDAAVDLDRAAVHRTLL